MFTIAGTQLNAQCDSIKEAAGSSKGSNEIMILHLFDTNTFDNSSPACTVCCEPDPYK